MLIVGQPANQPFCTFIRFPSNHHHHHYPHSLVYGETDGVGPISNITPKDEFQRVDPPTTTNPKGECTCTGRLKLSRSPNHPSATTVAVDVHNIAIAAKKKTVLGAFIPTRNTGPP